MMKDIGSICLYMPGVYLFSLYNDNNRMKYLDMLDKKYFNDMKEDKLKELVEGKTSFEELSKSVIQ